jgi:thymidylate synthase ThyX
MALHTHYVVTMNVRSSKNFFMLRLCVRAAPEIRALAMRMYKFELQAKRIIDKELATYKKN